MRSPPVEFRGLWSIYVGFDLAATVTAVSRTSASARSQSSRSWPALAAAFHIDFKCKTADLFFKIWMYAGGNFSGVRFWLGVVVASATLLGAGSASKLVLNAPLKMP